MGEPQKDPLAQKNPLREGMTSGLFGMVFGYAFPPRGVKFNRVAAAYRGAAMVGLYGLSYHGARNYLIYKRGVDDVYTTIGASIAGGASIGLTTKGPPLDRLKAAMAVIVVSVPLDLICHHCMKEMESKLQNLPN